MPTHCEHGNEWLDPGTPWPGGTNPYCKPCWRAAGGVAVVRQRPGKVARRGRCLHLGRRTEYRPGCGGWRCVHECEAGEPEAVPGGVCQTCHKWEGE